MFQNFNDAKIFPLLSSPDGITSPPATSSWFKKPLDSHDTFLDAKSCMRHYELSDQVVILV